MPADPFDTRNARAGFRDMRDCTAADWQIIGRHYIPYALGLPDRILAHLRLLAGDCGGYPVDRLTHCLQTATRAYRDGRDDEYVVCALLHDVGDTLGTFNHPDIAAAILKPFVSAQNHAIVQHHGVFQGYYYYQHIGRDRHARDQYAGQPFYDDTAEFCERYDAPAFDAGYDTLPLEFFEPAIRRVMRSPRTMQQPAAAQAGKHEAA